MTKLEKQLIALSAHGIWIEFSHGHRWVKCTQDNEHTDGCTDQGFNLHKYLKEHKVLLNGKFYGGVKSVILVIDEILEKFSGYTLEDYFDGVMNIEFDVEDISTSGRIDYDTKEGGLH